MVQTSGLHLRARLPLAAALLLAATAAPAQLNYLGQQTLPFGFMYSGTQVGGLSGIDRDPASGMYWAISDDRSQLGDARFYGLSLDLGQFMRSNTPGNAGVLFNSVATMKTPGGAVYPNSSVDPESIRLNPAASDRLAWASEGDRGLLINPFVREMTTVGAFTRGFPVPASYHMYETELGSRNNLAFESLTFSTDGTRLYAAPENALYQDGPAAALGVGSMSRVVAFDQATAAPLAQYAYPVDPVVAPPNPAGSFATNGLVELLAVSPTEFLAVERSFSNGVGNSIRLYLASLAGATDVSGIAALAGASFTAMAKTLLLDLATLRNDDGSPLVLDNIEGVTWGPTLPNGNRTLILVSDNNFSPTQFTQFVALEVAGPIPEPSTWATLAAGLLLLAFVVRRRAVRRV
jgi:hypothetical protein